MAKIKIEVQDEEKTTVYTADFEKTEECVKNAVDKVVKTASAFFKATFKKEEFPKTEEK